MHKKIRLEVAILKSGYEISNLLSLLYCSKASTLRLLTIMEVHQNLILITL